MKEYAHEFSEQLYYTPSLYEKDERIWPVRAGRNIAKPNYAVGPKQIECYSIHFVRSGRVHFEYPGGSADLASGDLFGMFPGCSYSYRGLPAEEPLQMYWTAFAGPGADGLMGAAGIMRHYPCKTNAASKQVWNTVEHILDELRQPTSSEQTTPLRLLSLFYRLFAELSESVANQPVRQISWIQRAIEYMKLHHTEKISVQHIADFIGVNRTYFATVFSEQTGMSPKAFLQKLQLDKAKHLLRQNEMTITEIAFTLGYPNLYSFSRFFKNCCGVYPQQFRNDLK
ncbi:MAG TPA: AraC family transcriptional regulator [Bacilli bacterium]